MKNIENNHIDVRINAILPDSGVFGRSRDRVE